MNNGIKFTVYGKPVPQQRPRFRRMGSFVHTYDPADCVSWKERVAWYAVQQKAKLLSGALEMQVMFFLPRPKSLPKKVKYPVKKPDLKNLLAGVEDALEDICYKNDSQIINERMRKRYVEPGEQPRTEIEIFEIPE